MTHDKLKEYLEYNPDTGEFRWLKPPSKRVRSGGIAGTMDGYGATIIKLQNKIYKANRLAWFYMTGAWPTHDIKTLNGIPEDVRWENLVQGTRER